MEMGGDKNIFIYWLMHLPWDDEQRARLQQTLWMYCVGGWRDGRVVFWQIDHQGTPRAAKLMKFYPMNHPKYGHRDKEAHPGWIYNQDGCRQQLEPDKHTILKPLFGCHLLNRYPDASINIVESEKTALVMANYYGNPEQQLWLACGGLKFLQLDSLQPLIDQGRTIWLWPDKDGRDDWQEVCDKLGYDKCRLYTQFFDTCWREEDGDKADIADIAIRMMRTGEGPREVESGTTSAISHQPSANPDTPLHWYGDQPFQDEEELTDPRIHQWRMAMRNAHSTKWYQRHYPDTMTSEEAVKDYPMLEPLLNDQTE